MLPSSFGSLASFSATPSQLSNKWRSIMPSLALGVGEHVPADCAELALEPPNFLEELRRHPHLGAPVGDIAVVPKIPPPKLTDRPEAATRFALPRTARTAFASTFRVRPRLLPFSRTRRTCCRGLRSSE